MRRHKKRTKYKRNSTIFRTGTSKILAVDLHVLVLLFSVTNVQKDMDVQRKSLRQINDRVVTLEKLMIDSHILLEKIRSTIQQEDKALPESHKFIHILSRESPYIYTNEARFPVTERYIPWKVSSTATFASENVSSPMRTVLLGSLRSVRSNVDHIAERRCLFPRRRTTLCGTEFVRVLPWLEFALDDVVRCRLKAITDGNEDSQPATDIFITPSTPVPQLNAFGNLEPSTNVVVSDVTIPLSEYKWNQIIELELPDGKKVRSRTSAILSFIALNLADGS